MKKLALLVSLSLVIILSTQHAYAAVDMFLKLEGIPGESLDKDHKGQIPIESWSWSTHNQGLSGGGIGAGKAVPLELSLLKRTDIATTKLVENVFTGKHIKTAELSLRKSGTEFDFAKYKMSDVTVNNIQFSGSSEIPMESFSLNFAKIEVQHTTMKLDGSPGTTSGVCWDFIKNISCSTTIPPPTPPSLPPTTPLPDDDDGDGILNSADNCQTTPNPSQDDFDGDLSGDACDIDDDNDGIVDQLDTVQLGFSNDFADNDDEPNTVGTINRGDQIVTVTDEADPGGVRVTAATGGDARPVMISVCSALVSLDGGEEVILTCDSVEVVVVTGSVDVTFTAEDGTTGTTTLNQGDSISFNPQTFSVTNTGATDVIITVNGNSITIPPGQTIDIDISPILMQWFTISLKVSIMFCRS